MEGLLKVNTMTDEQADAILDIRTSCLKYNKTIIYIVVNDLDPNKNIQIVYPREILDKEKIDSVLGVLMDVSDFDKRLNSSSCHVIWDVIIKNIKKHVFFKFILDNNKHIEMTTVKLIDLIRKD